MSSSYQFELEPEQLELLKTLSVANEIVPSDKRQAIRGIRGDGVLNLFHPGFTNRRLVPNDYDLQQLNELGLIRTIDRGGSRGWVVDILPAGKRYLASVEEQGADQPVGEGQMQPSVSNGFQERVATALKDHFTLSEINGFFQLADADPAWKVEPETDYPQQRTRLGLSWLQGISQNSPHELLRITLSVLDQVLGREEVSETNRRALTAIRGRLESLVVDEAKSLASVEYIDGTNEGLVTVFVAHGNHPSWAHLVLILEKTWDVSLVYFEESNRTAQQITGVVSYMTSGSSLAVVLMTGEDELADGNVRARQNVIHEAGMCHAELGFDRVALMIEDGVEKFSNAQGIVYIPYDSKRVTACLHDLGEFLERFGATRKQKN